MYTSLLNPYSCTAVFILHFGNYTNTVHVSVHKYTSMCNAHFLGLISKIVLMLPKPRTFYYLIFYPTSLNRNLTALLLLHTFVFLKAYFF